MGRGGSRRGGTDLLLVSQKKDHYCAESVLLFSSRPAFATMHWPSSFSMWANEVCVPNVSTHACITSLKKN